MKKFEQFIMRANGVTYRAVIEMVAEQIFARCSVETKIWFRATPGAVRLDLRTVIG